MTRAHVSSGSPYDSRIGMTRMLLIRIEDREAAVAVHGEVFGSIRPATTVMQVTRFVAKDWLVEIEADAILPAQGRA